MAAVAVPAQCAAGPSHELAGHALCRWGGPAPFFHQTAVFRGCGRAGVGRRPGGRVGGRTDGQLAGGREGGQSGGRAGGRAVWRAGQPGGGRRVPQSVLAIRVVGCPGRPSGLSPGAVRTGVSRRNRRGMARRTGCGVACRRARRAGEEVHVLVCAGASRGGTSLCVCRHGRWRASGRAPRCGPPPALARTHWACGGAAKRGAAARRRETRCSALSWGRGACRRHGAGWHGLAPTGPPSRGTLEWGLRGAGARPAPETCRGRPVRWVGAADKLAGAKHAATPTENPRRPHAGGEQDRVCKYTYSKTWSVAARVVAAA